MQMWSQWWLRSLALHSNKVMWGFFHSTLRAQFSVSPHIKHHPTNPCTLWYEACLHPSIDHLICLVVICSFILASWCKLKQSVTVASLFCIMQILLCQYFNTGMYQHYHVLSASQFFHLFNTLHFPEWDKRKSEFALLWRCRRQQTEG